MLELLRDAHLPNNLSSKKNNFSDEDLKNILQLIKEIKYGSITLVIQDGIIVQIDTNEKIRLK